MLQKTRRVASSRRCNEHCSPACQAALVDAVDAAPARQSLQDATRDCCSTVHAREAPSPQREQYEMMRSPISSNRRPFTRTTAWADLLEKVEAKGAAAVVDLAAAEMAGDAAGAVRASVEH